MIIYDIFGGIGGPIRKSWIEARGHKYVTFDINPKFGCDFTIDIMDLSPKDVKGADLIWGSPPCEGFSVAAIGKNWRLVDGDYIPMTETAKNGMLLVNAFLYLVEVAKPRLGWLMENPMGMLRKMPFMAGVHRYNVTDKPRSPSVTYCQYGETRMKPTDIWGTVKNWAPRKPCKPGASCHVRAPRGSRTGTQGIKGAANRAIVPDQLWLEIIETLEEK